LFLQPALDQLDDNIVDGLIRQCGIGLQAPGLDIVIGDLKALAGKHDEFSTHPEVSKVFDLINALEL
jgi:hypothetical protein